MIIVLAELTCPVTTIIGVSILYLLLRILTTLIYIYFC